MTRIEIAEEALKLSLEERLELAYALWHSVDSDALPLHPWQREILEKFYSGRRAEGCFAPFYGHFQIYVPPHLTDRR